MLTSSDNIHGMFSYAKALLFSFSKYFVTDIVWVKAENITTIITFHMFMVMLFAAFDLIFFLIVSQINFSNKAYFREKLERTKYAGSSNFRERFYQVFTLKEMHVAHFFKNSDSLRSYFFSGCAEFFFNFHINEI